MAAGDVACHHGGMRASDTPLITAPVEVIDEQLDPTLDDGDESRYAHIIRKSDEMRGYVNGEVVTALCGKKWVPSRDPQKYPVCPRCAEIMGQINARGSN